MINLEDYNPETYQEEISINDKSVNNITDSQSELLPIPQAEAKGEVIKEEVKESENIKTELSEEERKDLASRNASMYVGLIYLLVSRGCGLITGESHERYKLSKSEAEEYKKVSADYFYTVNTTVSPALVFMVSTLTIFSSIFFRAYADYKSKKRREKAELEAEERREAEARAEIQRRYIQQQQEQQRQAEIINNNTKTPEYNTSIPIEEEPPKRKKPTVYREEIQEGKENRSNFEIYTDKDKQAGSKTWTDDLLGKYKVAKMVEVMGWKAVGAKLTDFNKSIEMEWETRPPADTAQTELF